MERAIAISPGRRQAAGTVIRATISGVVQCGMGSF